MDNEQVQHSGIKGMKWGIRRYQYKDGTLTPAGKKRYNKDVEKLKEENAKLDAQIRGKKAAERAKARVEKLLADNEAKKKALKGEADDDAAKKTAVKATNDPTKEVAKPETKINKPIFGKSKTPISKMSDEEIQARIDRINLEQKYADLIGSSTSNGRKAKAKSFIVDVLESSASNIGKQAATYLMGVGVNKAFQKIFDDDKAINPKKGQKDK